MSKKAERLPWYRAKGYDGTLTEGDKRQLDAFRMQDKHHATDRFDLPEDVQGYINKLEFDLIDLKRQNSLNASSLTTVAAIAFSYYSYLGNGWANEYVIYTLSVVLIIFAWWKHRKKDKILVEELVPSGSYDPTNEAIMREWEVDYIVNKHKTESTDTLE